MRRSVRGKIAVFVVLASLLLSGCAADGPVPSSNSVTQVQDDFRKSLTETVGATGVAEKDFKYEGGQVFSAEDLKGDLKDFTQTCSGNAKDGFENEYSTGLTGGRRYATRAQWEAQAQKVKEHWQKLGWTVKNVAPGTEESPGITIGASTPAGVTVLYTVGQQRWDYVRVSSPCSAEIQ